MLTHPDPQIQALFNDITEQRDISMVAKVNVQMALTALHAEHEMLKASFAAQEITITALHAEIEGLKAEKETKQ